MVMVIFVSLLLLLYRLYLKIKNALPILKMGETNVNIISKSTELSEDSGGATIFLPEETKFMINISKKICWVLNIFAKMDIMLRQWMKQMVNTY